MVKLFLALLALSLCSTHLYADEITPTTANTSSTEISVFPNKTADPITITTPPSTPAVANQENATADKPLKKQGKVYQEPFMPLSLRTR